MNSLIKDIILQYREIQSAPVWIGSNYNKKLSNLEESEFFRIPLEGLHSIAEIISHLTLWRKETILKIESGKGSKTDDCEENWYSNDFLRTKGWEKIKSEYDESLDRIIELLESKEDSFLEQEYYDTDFKGNYPYRFVLLGMLHHDIYHLGQIGIIVKFLKSNPGRL